MPPTYQIVPEGAECPLEKCDAGLLKVGNSFYFFDGHIEDSTLMHKLNDSIKWVPVWFTNPDDLLVQPVSLLPVEEAAAVDVSALQARLEAAEKRAEEAERVSQDFAKQIIEARELREQEQAVAGQPMAWIVYNPPELESDYFLFTSKEDADDYAAKLVDATEIEQPPAIPLFTLTTELSAIEKRAEKAESRANEWYAHSDRADAAESAMRAIATQVNLDPAMGSHWCEYRMIKERIAQWSVDRETAWKSRDAAESRVSSLEEENGKLRELVSHAWVHSGYPDCGYRQMTREQRTLYNSILGRCDLCEGEGCRECKQGYLPDAEDDATTALSATPASDNGGEQSTPSATPAVAQASPAKSPAVSEAERAVVEAAKERRENWSMAAEEALDIAVDALLTLTKSETKSDVKGNV